MILFLLLTVGGLANLSLPIVGAVIPDQVPATQDDRSAASDQNAPPAVVTAIEAPPAENASPGNETPEVANPTADHEADSTAAVESVAGENPAQVMLHFKIFTVSSKRAAEADIDLAAILASESQSISSHQNNSQALLTTISPRERELLAKLLSVSGAAKLLAEPTLLTECGRKAKFFSGAEVPSPGPPKNGVVTKEFRDVGTKIEVTTSLRDAGSVVAELRVDYSEMDLSLDVPPNGFMYPPVRTRSVQTAFVLPLDETMVLGGQMFDGLLVMLTPELVVSGSDSVQPKQIVAHDQSEFSARSGQFRQLQMEIESLHGRLKELTDLVERGFAGRSSACEGPVPPVVPYYQPATPGHWPHEISPGKSKPQEDAGRDLGVNSKWEELPTGDSMFTIRIGSGLYKPLSDGSAVQVVLDGATRQLREFRVVIGPDSRQASAAESVASDAIGYGWRPNADGNLDYYVQVSRAKLVSSLRGMTLNCKVHPDVQSIDKIYVFIGDAPLPRQAAP
jgi:hypothetical protein